MADEDLSAGTITHNLVGRRAAVVTCLGAGVTLALLAWTFITTVGPLRAAAAHAAAHCRRTTRTATDAGAPQRVDEIGAIVTGLNRHLHGMRTASATRACPMPVSSSPDTDRRPHVPIVDVIPALTA